MPTHPGFGLFHKEHREFFDALDPADWQSAAGYAGVEQKALSGRLDTVAGSGSLTRLSRWAAGASISDVVTHDWCEEVYLISGSLSIGLPGAERQILGPGTYAVRPAGVAHGPFFTRNGCMMIEFHYYPPIDPMIVGN
ncbi:MAG: cupin [Pseudomonadota bacterium]